MKVTVIPIVIRAPRTIPKGLRKGTGRHRNMNISEHHPDESIINISQNTDKSSGKL